MAIEAVTRDYLPLVNVGDVLSITGTCRITAIQEEILDISTLGGPSESVAGERSYKLLITDAVFSERA